MQRVVVLGKSSVVFAVRSEVPKGFVLITILFLIFINYLPLEVISLVSLKEK